VNGGRRKIREHATEAHPIGKCAEGGKCTKGGKCIKGRHHATRRINKGNKA
jgi:hypothetical protein